MGLGWAAEHRSWNDRQVSTIMKVATLQLGHPDHRYWNKNVAFTMMKVVTQS